jgi:hypothetical protein
MHIVRWDFFDREGPDNFIQTTTWDPETGLREHIFIVGQTGRIHFSVGPHPIRRLLDGSFDIRLALPGFCNILR